MTIASFSGLEPAPAACRGGAVTIGNFDGVHLGHRSLLAELRRQAQAVGGPAVAVTFDPHPLQLLRPERFLPVLTTTADRAALLQAGGADEVLILRTSPELLRLTPDDFFTEVLIGRLTARALVEGQDFRFGRDRAGSVEALAALCRDKGLVLSVVPPLVRDGVVVSSSRVRNALLAGDVRKATALLGRPYRLHGTVGVGQRRGRRLGFPTANLERFETVVPGDGVYAVRAWLQGAGWPAAANVWPNPTFGEDARKVEVHLIGFSGDLYGAALTVDFVDRLRDTRPFDGVEDLVRQLRADVDQASRLAGAAS